MHFEWKNPTLENSPSLTVRRMIERYGSKYQEPPFTFHFKKDLIIMIVIRKAYFNRNLYEGGMNVS